jgi:hypothetical protein
MRGGARVYLMAWLFICMWQFRRPRCELAPLVVLEFAARSCGCGSGRGGIWSTSRSGAGRRYGGVRAWLCLTLEHAHWRPCSEHGVRACITNELWVGPFKSGIALRVGVYTAKVAQGVLRGCVRVYIMNRRRTYRWLDLRGCVRVYTMNWRRSYL